MSSFGIGYNNIGVEGADAVAAMLLQNTGLKSISLGGNNLGDAGVEVRDRF
jgi:hypothetical protein